MHTNRFLFSIMGIFFLVNAGPSFCALPAGVTLQDIDGGLHYYARWKNAFPTDSVFFPIGVFPAEGRPADLYAMGINFFLPMRDDVAGIFRPVLSGSPKGNDMAAVNAEPGFYAGASFYADLPWGNRAAFNMYGDELDGNCGNFLGGVPASVSSNSSHCLTDGCGLNAAGFLGADSATRAIDSSRPIFLGITNCFMDGRAYWHYTLAQKQAICAGADIMEYDMYPLVFRGGHVYDTYDQVQELRFYCQNARVVMPVLEMDHMDGGGIYPAPAQTVAEVWNAIIAGARGIIYFDQYTIITSTSYTGGGRYAAGEMHNAIKTVNSQIVALAPVINSPFANGYISATGQVSVMAKFYHNQFYVFAAAHAAGSQNVTFALTGASTGAATVLNESRSVNISGNKFNDAFADANAVHIYTVAGSTPVESGRDAALESNKGLSVSCNPVTASAEIRFANPARRAQVSVIDCQGRLIANYNDVRDGVVVWNAGNRVSGIYLVKVTAGEQTLAAKLLLQK